MHVCCRLYMPGYRMYTVFIWMDAHSHNHDKMQIYVYQQVFSVTVSPWNTVQAAILKALGAFCCLVSPLLFLCATYWTRGFFQGLSNRVTSKTLSVIYCLINFSFWWEERTDWLCVDPELRKISASVVSSVGQWSSATLLEFVCVCWS